MSQTQSQAFQSFLLYGRHREGQVWLEEPVQKHTAALWDRIMNIFPKENMKTYTSYNAVLAKTFLL